jgi:hypothetical protein
MALSIAATTTNKIENYTTPGDVTSNLSQNYDSTLEVWASDGTLLRQDDDGGGYPASRLAVSVTAGATYLVGLGSWGSTTGTATLTLSLVGVPQPPVDVAVVPGDASAAVTWAPPDSYGDILEYAVHYQEGSLDAQVQLVSGDQASVELTGLVNGRSYSTWIVARNAAGWSAATDPVAFTPRTPSSVGITVDVAAPASGDRYCVYIDVLSHEAWVPGETFGLTKNSTSFSGLSTGTTWAGCWGDPVGDYVFTATFPGTAAIAPRSCLPYACPGEAGGEDDGGAVGDGELVVAGGQSSPLLGQGEVAFDDVAAAVGGGVEPRWLAASGSAAFAGGDLVGLLGDDDPDPAGVQGAAVDAGGVGLVGDHGVGSGAWTPGAQARDADVGQDRFEQGAVVAVPAGDHRCERASVPVDGGVDLGSQPAA